MDKFWGQVAKGIAVPLVMIGAAVGVILWLVAIAVLPGLLAGAFVVLLAVLTVFAEVEQWWLRRKRKRQWEVTEAVEAAAERQRREDEYRRRQEERDEDPPPPPSRLWTPK